MKYFCSAIWNPNSTPVLFGIFSKFIALFSRAIWDEELYNAAECSQNTNECNSNNNSIASDILTVLELTWWGGGWSCLGGSGQTLFVYF